jgi:APA family basic amino acid/polyamine antiporter
VLNIFGVRLGAAVQNVFTFAKTAALLGLVLLGLFVGRNAQAIAANFGANFWHNSWLGALHPVQVGVGGPIALVGTITILAVAQVGSLFSADAWNNVTFTAGEVRNPQRNLPLSLAIGTGVVIFLYVMANVVYLTALPLVGDANGTTLVARGIQHASEDRVATAVMEQIFSSSGAKIMAVLILISGFGCNNGLILAGALASQVPHSGALAADAVCLDLRALHFGQLRTTAGLHHLCGVGFLHPDDCGAVCAASEATGCAAAIPCDWLPGAASHLHSDGSLH